MGLTDEEREAEIRKGMNRLRGQMCGLLESFGLPERQERAAVQALKSLSYDNEAHFVDIIKPHLLLLEEKQNY